MNKFNESNMVLDTPALYDITFSYPFNLSLFGGVENREFQFGGDVTTGYVQRIGPYMDCWQHSFFYITQLLVIGYTGEQEKLK